MVGCIYELVKGFNILNWSCISINNHKHEIFMSLPFGGNMQKITMWIVGAMYSTLHVVVRNQSSVRGNYCLRDQRKNTIDGCLYGVARKWGLSMWSREEGTTTLFAVVRGGDKQNRVRL